MSTARRVLLVSRPSGTPDASTWKIESRELPVPGPGQVLVRNKYISVDPAMRGWIGARATYIEPLPLGEVMPARAAGTVLVSNDPRLPVGTNLVNFLGVQTHTVTDVSQVRVVEDPTLPLEYQLSALGAPGMTAYFGLLEVGRCRPGETVLVSAAAGAVGQMVVQIARNLGCRVVGLAGGAQKCDFVMNQLGAEACIDYKTGQAAEQMRTLFADGIDIYFDNIGGTLLEEALDHLRIGARVVMCGAISQYDNLETMQGPRNYLNLLTRRATMTGMLVGDFEPRFQIGLAAMRRWIVHGRLDCQHHYVDGIDTFPQAFQTLFSGKNIWESHSKIGIILFTRLQGKRRALLELYRLGIGIVEWQTFLSSVQMFPFSRVIRVLLFLLCRAIVEESVAPDEEGLENGLSCARPRWPAARGAGCGGSSSTKTLPWRRVPGTLTSSAL